MKNIKHFYLKIFIFLVVKFSIYLNRHVFVMVPAALLQTIQTFWFCSIFVVVLWLHTVGLLFRVLFCLLFYYFAKWCFSGTKFILLWNRECTYLLSFFVGFSRTTTVVLLQLFYMRIPAVMRFGNSRTI